MKRMSIGFLKIITWSTLLRNALEEIQDYGEQLSSGANETGGAAVSLSKTSRCRILARLEKVTGS